jgi:hypothetical protein
LSTQALELAPVDDQFVRVVGIHAAKPQVGHDVLEGDIRVLHQIARLLEHGAQDMAVIGVARERTRTHHQAVLM